METRKERRRSMGRLAESERRPGEPRATRPWQARAGFGIMVLVLIVAVGLIAAMFINTARYAGNSPVPVSEQRRWAWRRRGRGAIDPTVTRLLPRVGPCAKVEALSGNRQPKRVAAGHGESGS